MTDIPYCDKTWDLTIGCKKRSPGCENCWACRAVHRLAARLPEYGGQTTEDGRDWLPHPSGGVNYLLRNLDKPLQWRKPSFIFVNSKSDLFDDRVPFEFIAKAFDTMWDTKSRGHRFMVLTKEPGRMAEFIEWYEGPKNRPKCWHWPNDFPHVILMVSVEGPKQMDRIETLMEIPAAMHGVSLEPLIWPVDLANADCSAWETYTVVNWLTGKIVEDSEEEQIGADVGKLDWVLVGCEKLLGGSAGRWRSGRFGDGRYHQLDWWNACNPIVRGCMEAGVPIWVKQGPKYVGDRIVVTDDPAEFSKDCRVQEKPEGLIPSVTSVPSVAKKS